MGNPSLPVPNHDPECKCLLDPPEIPAGFTVIECRVGATAGTARLAYDPGCPHHGPLIGMLSRGVTIGYGAVPWPATPA